MTSSLNERKRQILLAVINDYITTATPVASRTISKKYKIELSPATIRSVMADLEDMGLLYHPHTSAGRVPTKTGFKFYVDSLIQVKNLSEREKAEIESKCTKESKQIEDVMKETSKILSNTSNYAGIVLAPKKTQTIFKHIHFIKLRDRRLLAVLVTKRGIVHNKIIEMDENIEQAELDRIHNHLNALLKDIPLSKVKNKILKEMQKEKVKYDKLLSTAFNLGYESIFVPEDSQDLFLDGEVNLFEQPEFSDTKKLKSILKALERKTLLVEMLEKTLAADGIQIFVGAEVIDPGLKDISIITSRFTGESGLLGTIGIIGPTRMNYPKVIPLVDYTAKFLTKLLKED